MNKFKLISIFFVISFAFNILANAEEEASFTPPLNQKPSPATAKNLQPEEQPTSDNKMISLKLKNMDILEVFNILAQKGNLNIIAGNDVRGRVTLFLDNVEIWDAFLKIVETNSLAFIKDGDIIRVFTDREHEVLYGSRFYDKTITKIVPLLHVQAQVILPTLENLKSRIGKIVVDENSNAIIIIDSPTNCKSIVETIKTIDVPLTNRSYHLKYETAQVVAEKIKALISKRGTIYIDSHTNTIIVTDVPSVFISIEPIIIEYNKPRYIETRIIQLKYADYEEIKTKIEPELTPEIGSLNIDKRTNYLIINDLPENINRLMPVIAALDEKHLEVLIDVKICAIQLSDSYKFGINWEYVLTRFQHNNLGFNFQSALGSIAESAVSDTPIRPFDVRSTKLDGNDVSAYAPGGHVVFAGKMPGGKDGTGNPYQGILEMIRTLGDVDIISSPRIAVINGEEAKFQVGTNEAYVTNTVVQSTSNATNAENVNFIEVGVNLKVTPKINKDGYITMDIEPEVSNVARFLETSSGNRIPIIRTTNAKTHIMVEDGATIVLAGFIEKRYNKVHKKIPFLGSIPIVGLLFKRIEDEWNDQEIVIVITPKIIQGNEYAEEIEPILDRFDKEKKTLHPLLDDIDKLDIIRDRTGEVHQKK